MCEGQIFTKLDLWNTYHLIWIKADEYWTAFPTNYGQFQCQVMPFGSMSAAATFQAYIDDYLQPYIVDFAIYYLDNIEIDSNNQNEHEEHSKTVLVWVRQYDLYCKAEKCQFGASEVGFLGLIISSDGIGMESTCITTIEEWPTPNLIRDIYVLLGFANFYWLVIRKYDKVMVPISDLLKKLPGNWE